MSDVEATADLVSVNTSTIHSLLIHTSNLSARLTTLMGHAKALAAENSRLRAEIRASSAISGTAMARLCGDTTSSFSSPVRTAARALHESLAREEELSRALVAVAVPPNPPPADVDYYTKIHGDNTKLSNELRRTHGEVKRLRRLTEASGKWAERARRAERESEEAKKYSKEIKR